MLKAMLIEIMRDMCGEDAALDNPEYLRGQIEMSMNILGWNGRDDLDGDDLRAELMAAVKS